MLLNILRSKVKELKGFEPEIDWGKDGGLAKKRLKKYSFEEIRDLIDWYLNSSISKVWGFAIRMPFSFHD
jgi:hypothetical protein